MENIYFKHTLSILLKLQDEFSIIWVNYKFHKYLVPFIIYLSAVVIPYKLSIICLYSIEFVRLQ